MKSYELSSFYFKAKHVLLLLLNAIQIFLDIKEIIGRNKNKQFNKLWPQTKIEIRKATKENGTFFFFFYLLAKSLI